MRHDCQCTRDVTQFKRRIDFSKIPFWDFRVEEIPRETLSCHESCRLCFRHDSYSPEIPSIVIQSTSSQGSGKTWVVIHCMGSNLVKKSSGNKISSQCSRVERRDSLDKFMLKEKGCKRRDSGLESNFRRICQHTDCLLNNRDRESEIV